MREVIDMGDRGQVLIKDTGVYLYTHWAGYRLKEDVKRALKRKQRWNDDEYLARIIFDEMKRLGKDKEKDYMTFAPTDTGETGYGIGTILHTDLNNPLITIDCEKQRIKIGKGKWQSFKKFIGEGD
jgi:hypothetical protein